MSSTTEHQNETPPRSDSVSPSKDGDNAHLNKSHDGMPPAPKPAKDVFDIATEFATSRLGNLAFEEGKETVVNKVSDEEFFSDEEVEHPVKVGENTDPKLTAGTASNSENASGASTKENEEATTSKGDQEQVSHGIKANENTNPKLTSETTPKLEDTSSATSKKNEEVTTPESNDTTTDVPRDETATPRLAAYIKLHNDMMASKSALASSDDEQMHLHHHAEHVARTLLASNAKHSDLPLVMHAHACLVLGCSNVDDCVEMMEEALKLVSQAVKEGLLGEKEGIEMVKCCEAAMGGVLEEDDDDDDDDDDDGDEGEGEGGEERVELP